MAARRRSLFTSISLSSSVRSLHRPHRLFVAAALALTCAAAPLATTPRAARAQAEATVPEVETAKQKMVGRLSTDTLVFAGPGNQFYPTMKLKAGTSVVVTGWKKDWLRIVPPEGSFSYAPKALINAYGDATSPQKHGKVNGLLIVKAGSKLQPVKWAVQTRLEKNDDVTIIGEEDEYFLIKPPDGAFVYINKAAVEPVGAVQDGGAARGQPQTRPDAPGPIVEGSIPTGPGEGTSPTGPTTRDIAQAFPGAPTTQPNSADLLTQLQALEAQFAEISQKPLVEQPAGELLDGYQKLVATPGLPDMAKRIADVRVKTLQVRVEAKEQFAAMQKQQGEFQERLRNQKVENDEIQQRIKEVDIQVYAAVGTLRTSSLQVAKTPLYRLTDPQTGRTVVYVWATDQKIPESVGKFIGVKGPIQTDARLNLKVVSPTAVEEVDPAKVNNSVAAQISPQSLMPKAPAAPTASTDGQ